MSQVTNKKDSSLFVKFFKKNTYAELLESLGASFLAHIFISIILMWLVYTELGWHWGEDPHKIRDILSNIISLNGLYFLSPSPLLTILQIVCLSTLYSLIYNFIHWLFIHKAYDWPDIMAKSDSLSILKNRTVLILYLCTFILVLDISNNTTTGGCVSILIMIVSGFVYFLIFMINNLSEN